MKTYGTKKQEVAGDIWAVILGQGSLFMME